MSVRLRLIIYLTAVIAVFWVASAFISRSVMVNEINEISSKNLSVAAMRLMPLALREVQAQESEPGEGEAGEREMDEELRFLPGGTGGGLVFELRDRSGAVKLRSFDADQYKFPDDVHPGFHEEDGLTTVTVTDRETGLSLTVGGPVAERKEAINEATIALFTPLLLMLPLIALAIIYVARQVVEPLRKLRLQISTRGGSNLDKLDSADLPAELRPIADAVDRLLERLRASMEAERDFAANSAHELKTPIAGALAQTQRLKAELADGPGKDRALEIETTLKRLSEFTDKLLQLSRAEAEPHVHTTRENIEPVLDLAVREFTDRFSNPAQITVENRLNQDLLVAMDPDALAICLRNLLENAIRHGDGKSPVELIVDTDWSIHIINSGPVVPEDALDALMQRFSRGDTCAPGSGLGLSIVERIMAAAGGSLTLHSPATGRDDGFEAVLRLP